MVVGSRRGNLVIALALGLTGIMAVGALVVDLGYARVVHAQLQDAADAAAHGGAAYLDGTEDGIDFARQAAVDLALMNVAAGNPVRLDPNEANDAAGDVVIGWWDWDTDEFVPSLDPDEADAVLVRTRDAEVSTFFGGVAFGSGDLAASADSIAVMPAPTSAGAVDCYIPLAIPDCMFEKYPGESILEVDFVLSPDNADNIGWGLEGENVNANALRHQIRDCNAGGEIEIGDTVSIQNGVVSSAMTELGDAIVDSDTTWDEETWGAMEEPYTKSYPDNYGAYGNTFEGPVIVFDAEGQDCDQVKYNQDSTISGFVMASVFDVQAKGKAADKNIKVRLDLEDEIEFGTAGGGTMENGVVYQPPPMIVR